MEKRYASKEKENTKQRIWHLHIGIYNVFSFKCPNNMLQLNISLRMQKEYNDSSVKRLFIIQI